MRGRRPVARRVDALAAATMLALAGTGCYRYVPVAATDVGPQEEVRVRVTNAAAGRLAGELGRFTTQLEGQLARAGPDSVSVAIALADAGAATTGATLGRTPRQLLYLGPAELVAVERRELSRSRTALGVVGALVLFGAVVATVTQQGDPNPPTTEPPPPPPTARVGFRIAIP